MTAGLRGALTEYLATDQGLTDDIASAFTSSQPSQSLPLPPFTSPRATRANLVTTIKTIISQASHTQTIHNLRHTIAPPFKLTVQFLADDEDDLAPDKLEEVCSELYRSFHHLGHCLNKQLDQVGSWTKLARSVDGVETSMEGDEELPEEIGGTAGRLTERWKQVGSGSRGAADAFMKVYARWSEGESGLSGTE
jgi:hypothetical protein